MTRRRAIVTLIAIITGGISFFYLKRRNVLLRASEYRDIILEIAETIIPKTDTPGAKDAGVDKYVINTIESCLSSRDKTTVLLGLEDIEEYCNKRYSSSFETCTHKNKMAALVHFQKKGVFENALLDKVKNKLFGPSFFEIIKDLTVTGYCISKIGANQGLAYDHIPGDYLACMPLTPNQRSWATA